MTNSTNVSNAFAAALHDYATKMADFTTMKAQYYSFEITGEGRIEIKLHAFQQREHIPDNWVSLEEDDEEMI